MNSLSHLRPLIMNGTIVTFDDFFEHCSVAEVARAMGKSDTHVQSIRKGTGKVYLEDVFKLSEEIGVHWKRVVNLWVE